METWLKGQQHPNFQRLREMISANQSPALRATAQLLLFGEDDRAKRVGARFEAMERASNRGRFLP